MESKEAEGLNYTVDSIEQFSIDGGFIHKKSRGSEGVMNDEVRSWANKKTADMINK